MNAIIVGKKFGGHLKISKGQKVRDFFVLLLAIVHGKMKIGDVERMHLIG